MQPFRDYELSEYFQNIKDKISKEIDNFSDDKILGNSIDLLAENIYQENYIDQIIIHDEDKSLRGKDRKITRKYIHPIDRDFYDNDAYRDVEVASFSFSYPFNGNANLFKYRASTFSMSGYPEILIMDNTITISIDKEYREIEDDSGIKSILDSANKSIGKIKDGVSYINNDIRNFNDNLKDFILKQLNIRKRKASILNNAINKLEIPIEKSDFNKKYVEVKRKIYPINEHLVNNEISYSIPDGMYEPILDTIKSAGTQYENSPKAIRKLQEEDLRDILLCSLNALFNGKANAEAFRKSGKTDISIIAENKAAFIAECKMWTGSAQIEKAIKQLDSYTTWRDVKTSLIFFVRKVNFIKIINNFENDLKKIDGLFFVEKRDENEFHCKYSSKTTVGQTIEIRVFLFNIHYKEDYQDNEE